MHELLMKPRRRTKNKCFSIVKSGEMFLVSRCLSSGVQNPELSQSHSWKRMKQFGRVENWKQSKFFLLSLKLRRENESTFCGYLFRTRSIDF